MNLAWSTTSDAEKGFLNVRWTSGLEKDFWIPEGFLYRWVSCPNYLGEIIQWTGFAVAMNALAGWSFVCWTIANLLPRALRHHQWYIQQFEDYPASRRAIVPGIL